MKKTAPLGIIRPLALGLGRGGRRWRGGPLVPMIWRRRLPVRPARVAAAPAAVPPPFAPTYVFNLSLAWPAGTAARIETRRTQLAAGPSGGRGPRLATDAAQRLWSRLDRTVLNIIHRAEMVPAMGGTAEAPSRPGQAPRLPHLPASARTRVAAAPRSGRPRLRGGAIRLWSGQPARTDVPEAGFRETVPASQPGRKPAALVWRSGTGRGEAPSSSPALPDAPPRQRTELVWRRPAPGEAAADAPATPEATSPRPAFASAPAAWRGDTRTEASRSEPAPAVPPVEMNRLVDEVVRRLDRIGRDERLRRGL